MQHFKSEQTRYIPTNVLFINLNLYRSSAILEVIEPDGMTTIQISNTGGTSILKAMPEHEESGAELSQELTPDNLGMCY